MKEKGSSPPWFFFLCVFFNPLLLVLFVAMMPRPGRFFPVFQRTLPVPLFEEHQKDMGWQPQLLQWGQLCNFLANLQTCDYLKTFKQTDLLLWRGKAAVSSLLIQPLFSSGLGISSGSIRPSVGDEVSSSGSGKSGCFEGGFKESSS